MARNNGVNANQKAAKAAVEKLDPRVCEELELWVAMLCDANILDSSAYERAPSALVCLDKEQEKKVWDSKRQDWVLKEAESAKLTNFFRKIWKGVLTVALNIFPLQKTLNTEVQYLRMCKVYAFLDRKIKEGVLTQQEVEEGLGIDMPRLFLLSWVTLRSSFTTGKDKLSDEQVNASIRANIRRFAENPNLAEEFRSIKEKMAEYSSKE